MNLKSITLAAILVGQFAHAQSKVHTRLDSLFTALDAKKQFNGTVLVADKGQIIFEKSFGFAQLQPRIDLNSESMFELASVSKQFTAMGIVLLQKQGKLDYDDLLAKYLPELDFYQGVTIRNLLQHTAGLPDYMELMATHWDKSKIANNNDVIAMLVAKKPEILFAPNAQFEYSNTNYALLASIIEKVSKQKFGDYLHKNIFKPLKMNRTMVHRSRYAPQKIDNYAFGYEVSNLFLPISPDSYGPTYMSHYLDGVVGDGMVNSTARDLLLWDRSLYGNTLVNDADKALIFGTVQTLDGKPTNYGFGWGVATSPVFGKVINHTGGWAGYSTLIERLIDHDKTIIILQNYTPAGAPPVYLYTRKILFDLPIPEANYKEVQLTAEEINKYAGTYAHPDFPLKIMVFEKDGYLMSQATGQRSFPTKAFNGHLFTFEPAGITLKFDLDAKTMLMKQGNQEFLMQKE